jgi:hypothetical protein
MFSRPGSSEHWRVNDSPFGGDQTSSARGEEKIDPSVRVLRFEIKIMRQTVKHTMNHH